MKALPRPPLPLKGYELDAWFLLLGEGLPVPVCQHRFAKPRRWMFDFAWPQMMVALEIEGGSWVSGRHVRGSGFIADCEKYSTAASQGWRIVRVVPEQITVSEMVAWVRGAILKELL